MRLLASYPRKPQPIFARRGRVRAEPTLSGLQRKPAFPTCNCASIGSISTCRIWTNSRLEHLAGTPIAPTLAAASPDARAKLAASVSKQLERYADGDGVKYPEETHVLTARVQ